MPHELPQRSHSCMRLAVAVLIAVPSAAPPSSPPLAFLEPPFPPYTKSAYMGLEAKYGGRGVRLKNPTIKLNQPITSSVNNIHQSHQPHPNNATTSTRSPNRPSTGQNIPHPRKTSGICPSK